MEKLSEKSKEFINTFVEALKNGDEDFVDYQYEKRKRLIEEVSEELWLIKIAIKNHKKI